MKLIKIINIENASEKEVESYRIREAGRAVVIDGDNKVALLHVSKENYYKLPGGGIEEGEDKIMGLKRECQEEIGCDIEVLDEIGFTVEYWKFDKEKQTSYCYFAKVLGDKGLTSFTENELSKGFTPVWLPYEEALKSILGSIPSSKEGEYIVPRDTAFLKEVETLIKQF